MSDNGNRIGETTKPVERASRPPVERSAIAIEWIVNSAIAGFEILSGPRLRIGRSKHCELRLDHRSVSREHAELQRQGSTYALRDLESTNGTWVNGTRLEHAAISAGDVLRFGDCIGIVADIASGVGALEFANLAPGLYGGPGTVVALAKARIAAPSDVPLVIVGETGVGKECIARALHHWSGRSGPFVAINCSAVPGSLAEAEFFGHQRGAFTGAERARLGHFQAAHRGTLFLDEIADLPLDIQPKLLRAVEMGEVTPLGGTASTPVDSRIIAATHEPLEALVAKKRFRPDLAARLGGFVVEVPPLRRRREEIFGFFLALLRKHGSEPIPHIEPALVEWLSLRDWPGNVREIELTVRKLLALHAAEPALTLGFAEALSGIASPRDESSYGEAPLPTSQARFRDRRENDRYRLQRELARTNGNLTAAAASIGISRRRAYRLLQAAKPGESAASSKGSSE